MRVLYFLSFGIGILGVAVIVWGAITAFISLLLLEGRGLKGLNICKERDNLRHHLGSYILLGLEFLIAANIIKTVARPTYEDLIILGSIVVIRTILSYFLNKEMESRHNCSDN